MYTFKEEKIMSSLLGRPWKHGQLERRRGWQGAYQHRGLRQYYEYIHTLFLNVKVFCIFKFLQGACQQRGLRLHYGVRETWVWGWWTMSNPYIDIWQKTYDMRYITYHMFGWTVVQSFWRAKMTDGNTFKKIIFSMQST